MRLILLSTLLTLCSYSFLQTPEDDRMTFTEIVKVTNDKEALFKNAKLWIITNVSAYQSSVLFEDKDIGKIIAKGQKNVRVGFVENYKFVMTVDVQNKKYRLSITDIEQGFGAISQSYVPLENTICFDQLNAKKAKIEKDISRLEDSKKMTKNIEAKISLLKDQKTAIETRIEMEKEGREALLSDIKELQASFKKAMVLDDAF